jgi:chemotaxis protein CheY-P-specific phosphatase CheC
LMSSSSTTSELITPPGFGEAMVAGLGAARVALARLFIPAPVALQAIDRCAETLANELAADPKARHLGVAFDVSGPVSARLVVLAVRGDDSRLSAALLRRSWAPEPKLDHDSLHAFSEMANIIASSFLNGVARELRLTLIPSVPSLPESPLEDVVASITAAPAWALGARFTVGLPAGEASGLFVAAPGIASRGP